MEYTLAVLSARRPPAQHERDDFVEIVIAWDSKVSVAAETINAKRKNTFGQPIVRRVSCREQQLRFCTARRWPSIAQRDDYALICRMSERAHEILCISAFMSLAMILKLSLAQDR